MAVSIAAAAVLAAVLAVAIEGIECCDGCSISNASGSDSSRNSIRLLVVDNIAVTAVKAAGPVAY